MKLSDELQTLFDAHFIDVMFDVEPCSNDFERQHTQAISDAWIRLIVHNIMPRHRDVLLKSIENRDKYHHSITMHKSSHEFVTSIVEK